MATALISGIYGQDGLLLAKFLFKKDYRVIGIARTINPALNNYLLSFSDKLEIVYEDLLIPDTIKKLVQQYSPSEIYNLAGLSLITQCENNPIDAIRINTEIPLRFLNFIHNTDIKFYQASSAEIFGNSVDKIQNETTQVSPRNIYGVSKAAAHNATQHFREVYNVFACSGIMYNHESEFRAQGIVTTKIINNLLRIKYTSDKSKFALGNINSLRDWGYAGDYVKAMWLMLQHNEASDYVVASNKLHSVREFLSIALRILGLGDDLEQYTNYDLSLSRSNESGNLQGNYTKINKILGWRPEMEFENLIEYLIARKSEIFIDK